MRRLPVRYRSEAIEDLSRLFFAIEELSGSATVASAYVRRLRRRCDRIGDVPYGGRARDDLEPGLRMIAYRRSAVILYAVREDFVEVANIFVGVRDYEDLYTG
ncbi:type II toxin-antitoxin system RelE/ParE family toxin [Salinarimonas sp. NSM]|uniref:type II toxin-antitoxin system RelE/ParE family toxin n=1 Tax=Salinarimonas sp. NSM TaxID=3458003 RepID=UPI004036AE4F